MTMRIVFLKKHGEHKPDEEKFIARQEAVELCEKGIAVTFNLYEKMQRKKAVLKAKEEEQRKADEKAAKEQKEKDRKAELLRKKAAAKPKQAVSKRAKKAEKSIK